MSNINKIQLDETVSRLIYFTAKSLYMSLWKRFIGVVSDEK